MHLFALIRGEKSFQDNFLADLSAQYFPFKYKHPDTGQETNVIQLGVRPVRLVEFTFPKECLNEVHATISTGTRDSLPLSHMLIMAGLRKALGASKIPPIPEGTMARITRKFNVEVFPIGIREDVFNEDTQAEQL